MTTVERREVQRLSQRARAAFARLRGGLDRKSSPKVPRKHLAPPAAPSLARIPRDEETADLGRIELRRENALRCGNYAGGGTEIFTDSRCIILV